MHRRDFLRTSGLVGTTVVAGCSSGDGMEVTRVTGLSESDVFKDVRYEKQAVGLIVTLHESAAVEQNVDEIEMSTCGSDGSPVTDEYDVEPGQTKVETGTPCAGEVTLVAYGPNDEVIDHITLTVEE